MPKLFTVDRLGALQEGMVLDLVRFEDISPPELQQHVDLMFPSGVSRHGDNYFLESGSLAKIASPAIELLFEYVRRAHFPERPSRFTSVFGVESFSAAREFKAKYGKGSGTIWEVEAECMFRANMSLLTVNQSNLMCSFLVHNYWQGKPGPQGLDPFWEVLLVPPVRVLGLADDTGTASPAGAGPTCACT